MPLRLLRTLLRHCFPGLNTAFAALPDRRRPDRLRYTVPQLLWLELLMLLGGVGSRYAMRAESKFTGWVATLGKLAGGELATAPHPDSVYVFLQTLAPGHLERLLARLTATLLRRRVFDRYRFRGAWRVAVDATWLRQFDHAHCPQCLRQRQPDGTVLYFHAVLEAKLVLTDGLVLPLASVPIENLPENADKQDCEMAAFPRLAEKLRRRCPTLPVCLLGDALYACGPVIERCHQYGWHYVLVLKEGRTPALFAAARAAAACQAPHHVVRADDTVQDFTWATDLAFAEQEPHAIFCDETARGQTAPTHWAWLTDYRPDAETAPKIANRAGRARWKIENEAFNALKHGPAQQAHDFGSTGHAWYNTWLLAQLATLLLQLLQCSDVLRLDSSGRLTHFADLFPTLRSFAARLRESCQRDAACDPTAPAGCQLRFSSS